MSNKRYELLDIILPYLYKDGDKTKLKENAPESVKKAFEEYIKIPPETDVF